MAELSKYVFNQWLLDSGAPNNAGTVTVFDTGTSDLSDIYSDAAETVLANPFTLSATGRVQTGDLFLGEKTYDMIIKDSAGNTIATTDSVKGSRFDSDTISSKQILYGSSTGAIAQSSLFNWDYTNGRLGIGTATPGTKLEIESLTPYITLRNSTEEDTEGGRESQFLFEGEQSGGEVTTLAKIQASHDGTSDDQKGDLIFYTNDGSDGTSPTEALRLSSAQLATFAGNIVIPDDGTIGSATDTDALALSSTGQLGVGVTPSGASQLQVHEGDATGCSIRMTNTTTGTGDGNGLSIGFNDSEAAYVNNAYNSAMTFYTNNTLSMVLGTDQNVGIGVAPTGDSQLQVHEGDSTSSSIRITNTTTGTGDGNGLSIGFNASEVAYINNAENSNLLLYTNNTVALTLSNAQLATFAGNLIIPDGGTIGSATDTDALALSSTGQLGVGVTPAGGSQLQVHEGDGTGCSVRMTNTDTGTGDGAGLSIGFNDSEAAFINNTENTSLTLYTNNTTALTISNAQLATFAGTIATTSADNWDLNDYSAGTSASSTGAIKVTINGTDYYLDCSTSAPS